MFFPHQTVTDNIYKEFSFFNIEEDDKIISYENFKEILEKSKKLSFKQINEYLKQITPPITYIGKGTTRITYVMGDGKCLKIAFNRNGIRQNKNEISILEKFKDYDCFPKLYDYDSKHYSILCSCCKQAKKSDFKKFYGISLFELSLVLTSCVHGGIKRFLTILENAYKTKDFSKTVFDMYKENPVKWINFLKEMLTSKELKFKVLRDIVKCELKSKHYFSVSDLHQDCNWGMTKKDGQDILVVIDSGTPDYLKI